jgi:hypothetical protein
LALARSRQDPANIGIRIDTLKMMKTRHGLILGAAMLKAMNSNLLADAGGQLLERNIVFRELLDRCLSSWALKSYPSKEV